MRRKSSGEVSSSGRLSAAPALLTSVVSGDPDRRMSVEGRGPGLLLGDVESDEVGAVAELGRQGRAGLGVDVGDVHLCALLVQQAHHRRCRCRRPLL